MEKTAVIPSISMAITKTMEIFLRFILPLIIPRIATLWDLEPHLLIVVRARLKTKIRSYPHPLTDRNWQVVSWNLIKKPPVEQKSFNVSCFAALCWTLPLSRGERSKNACWRGGILDIRAIILPTRTRSSLPIDSGHWSCLAFSCGILSHVSVVVLSFMNSPFRPFPTCWVPGVNTKHSNMWVSLPPLFSSLSS